MIVSLIVAMDRRGGIAKNGQVPWRLSADLKLFKRLTQGHTLLVGRKTYESMGRNLPGRRMLILTHQSDFQAPGCEIVDSLEDAFTIAENYRDRRVFHHWRC